VPGRTLVGACRSKKIGTAEDLFRLSPARRTSGVQLRPALGATARTRPVRGTTFRTAD
jgi:hypothetical protein